MRFVALAGPDGERGRAAWGSEADALEDVASLQFVLDFIIVPFCAFSVVDTPTIGRPNFVWSKLRQYPFIWANVGPGPRFVRCKWGRPLLVVPSSEPTQQYAGSHGGHLGPPKLDTKIGGSAYWTSVQVNLPTFHAPSGAFKF